MKFNVKHIFVIIFLAIVAASIYGNVYLFFKNQQLKKVKVDYETKHKVQDSIITQSEIRVEKLEDRIEQKNKTILESQFKIDSIIALRKKNSSKYKDIIEEVEDFDNQSIENYWKDEFN